MQQQQTHTLSLMIATNWKPFIQLRGDRKYPLKVALIRNHRPASSCLLQQLKCNSSGCSFPGCQYNSQEITLSNDLPIQEIITPTSNESMQFSSVEMCIFPTRCSCDSTQTDTGTKKTQKWVINNITWVGSFFFNHLYLKKSTHHPTLQQQLLKMKDYMSAEKTRTSKTQKY